MDAIERFSAFQKLTIDIQTLETEAVRLGLHVTMHALNNAKNAAGWEVQGDVENAARASKGIRSEENAGP